MLSALLLAVFLDAKPAVGATKTKAEDPTAWRPRAQRMTADRVIMAGVLTTGCTGVIADGGAHQWYIADDFRVR